MDTLPDSADRYSIYQHILLDIASCLDDTTEFPYEYRSFSLLHDITANSAFLIYAFDTYRYDPYLLPYSNRLDSGELTKAQQDSLRFITDNLGAFADSIPTFKIPINWYFEMPNRRVHIVNDYFVDQSINTVHFSPIVLKYFGYEASILTKVTCYAGESFIFVHILSKIDDNWTLVYRAIGWESD